jgi:hypothetical protein
MWKDLEKNGIPAGKMISTIGFVCILLCWIPILSNNEGASAIILGIGLAALSVGLGLIAIGMSCDSDLKYTEILKKIDKNTSDLPLMFKGDYLTPYGESAVNAIKGQKSKENAQRRLDEDTKKNGYVRGEVYQLEDGTWAIAWGGKYPL